MENGFNIYILINILVNIEMEHNEEEDEENEIESLFKDSRFESFKKRKHTILSEFNLFANYIYSAGKGYWNIVKNKFKKNRRYYQKKEEIQVVLNFFSNFVVHIEIFRDNRLQKIFFPLLPHCLALPRDLKKKFNEKVNRANSKIKVEELIAAAPSFIKVMKHQEKLRLFFNKNKFIGMIANHEKLWKKCAFYINLMINFIIIVSYTSKFVPTNATKTERNYIRLNNPYFFEDQEFDNTQNVIIALGVVNLSLGATVVILF